VVDAIPYDLDWREDTDLGGRHVRLRLLRPDDRERLSEGFYRLSDQGRYQRFLAAKTRLTGAELAYLTELDQQTHLAIGASELTADGREGRGLGVARFICDPADPEVAEAAIAVVDDAQGQGLGRQLLSHLVEAARSRGVRRFRGEVLASNVAALRLLESVGTPVLKKVASGVTCVEVELPGAEPRGSKAYELLRLVASDKLRIRRFLSWLDRE
jgi:GNAT superfamily N-acetyltransferase